MNLFFNAPNNNVPDDCAIEKIKPKKPTVGNGNLKIDCSRIGQSSIDYIVRILRRYLKVQLVGGNVIYTEGFINTRHYNEVWRTLDCFDVKLLD